MRVVDVQVTHDEGSNECVAQMEPFASKSTDRRNFSAIRGSIPNAKQDRPDIRVKHVPTPLVLLVLRMVQQSDVVRHLRQSKQSNATFFADPAVQPRYQDIASQSRVLHRAAQMCLIQRYQVRLWRIQLKVALKFSSFTHETAYIDMVQDEFIENCTTR